MGFTWLGHFVQDERRENIGGWVPYRYLRKKIQILNQQSPHTATGITEANMQVGWGLREMHGTAGGQ